jgi:tetratricopeptide (TPR) repeat protein
VTWSSAGGQPGAPGFALSSPRRWLLRGCALVLLPLVVLALAEGGLRLTGYGYRTGFFKPERIGLEDYLVNSETFPYRFFPPEVARFPGPIRMAAHKPPGTLRIFILGESAAMGDPEPAYGPARYLEALLRERFPGQNFEVVNVAFTAINSHVILPIARECARHEGDIWLVYMGHNEMVGPFGAATVFGAQAPSLGFVRLSLAVQKTRLGQLLVAMGRKLRSKSPNSGSWAGMQMFVGNRMPPGDKRKEVVYRSFEQNLEDIMHAGLGSGAKVILNTVAVNLKDCPPFASLASTNLTMADLVLFQRLYASGTLAQGKGQFTVAAGDFEQGANLNPQSPDLQFCWAECQLNQGNMAAAREHFQRACDYDALPFRADSRLNRLIKRTARLCGDTNLLFLDANAALEAELRRPKSEAAAGTSGKSFVPVTLGQEFFYEHVHLNFDGSYRLGRVWAGAIEKCLPEAVKRKAAPHTSGATRGANWASQQECERRIGLSDWNRCLVLESVLPRFYQPPLNGQFNNGARVAALQARVKELRQRMGAGQIEKTRADFLWALSQAPNDHYLHENFAGFLQSLGDLEQSLAEWRKVHELMPHDYLAYFELGRLLGMQRKWPEAQTSLLEAVKLHPSLTEGWFELGSVHFAQEKFAEAQADFARATKQQPRDSRLCFGLAKSLSKMNRKTEAAEQYREAIGLKPDFWEAHYGLGGELAEAGKISEAGGQFAEVVRLQPAFAMGHFNLAVAYLKEGLLDAASREFEETLRLDPANQAARAALQQTRTTTPGH